MAIHTASVAEKFTPDHVTPHDGQTARVIYPGNKQPKGGYAVLINTSLSSFTTATEFSQYNELGNVSQFRIAYAWLLAGGAVVTAPLTVSRGGTTGNNITDASYDPDSGLYGAAYTGNGVYIPPGENPGSAAIEPWLDPDRHMPEKDVWYLRHWVARRAAALGLDNGRVSYMGSSAGAMCGTLAIYGADQRIALGLNDVRSSELGWAACISMNQVSRLRTMGQATALGFMFPGKTDTPAFDTPATTLGDAELTYQDALSFLTFDVGVNVPLYLGNNSPTYGVALDAPYDDNAIVNDFHSVDFGAMIKRARPVHRFVAFDDLIALNGDEEAAYDDNAADDDSPYVADVISNLESIMQLENAPVANASIQPTVTEYANSVHYVGTALDNATWTKVVEAGPHKMALIQNVTLANAVAVLLVMTAGDLGAPTDQYGIVLHSPVSSATAFNADSSVMLPTAGEAIYLKSNAAANKANAQVIVYS